MDALKSTGIEVIWYKFNKIKDFHREITSGLFLQMEHLRRGAGLSVAGSSLLFGFALLVTEVIVDDGMIHQPLTHHLLDLHT